MHVDRPLDLIIFSVLNIINRKKKTKYFSFLLSVRNPRLICAYQQIVTSNGKSVAKRTQLFHGIFIIDFCV